MSELTLIEQRTVNNVLVDGYYGSEEAWFTRFQIGEALEYSDPITAITKIHNRHPERFEGKSVTTKLVGTDGKSYDMWVYNFKGVLEICRWSKQPKADMVMDALYDMAESVVKRATIQSCPQKKPSKHWLKVWNIIISWKMLYFPLLKCRMNLLSMGFWNIIVAIP